MWYLIGGSSKQKIVTAKKTSQMRLMTYAPAVMGLKVRKPSCTVGTLAIGTASKGPRAIPAALQVTKAAGTVHQCHCSQLRLKYSTKEIDFYVLGSDEDRQQTMTENAILGTRGIQFDCAPSSVCGWTHLKAVCHSPCAMSMQQAKQRHSSRMHGQAMHDSFDDVPLKSWHCREARHVMQ